MIDKLLDFLFRKTAHFFGTLDEPWYSWVNALANRLILVAHPEKMVRLGELNPDRIIYLIRDLPPEAGVASWHDRVLGYLLYAQKKGWTPVVEPQPPAQVDSGVWYDYFKPVSDIPLADALRSKRVIVATVRGMIYKRFSWSNIRRRHPLCARVQLTDRVRAFVDDNLERVFAGMPHPIVGVRFRGTDYRVKNGWCAVGHAKVPDVDEFCERVESDCRKWGVPLGEGEHLFLMTEEKEAFDKIRQRYPKCRFVDKELFANYGFNKCLCYLRLPHTTPMLNNYNYLSEIAVLSRCDYLVGGYNGGVLVALNLNGGKYKGVDIIKTGVN